MLSGIHPALSGELLLQLDRLGHGDEFAVVDGNFPAHRIGIVVVDVPGLDAAHAVEAIRTVVPLDQDEGASVLLMSGPVGEADPVSHGPLRMAAAAPSGRIAVLERFAFYDRARTSRLVVRTGERALFADIILRKGVVVAPIASHHTDLHPRSHR
jgi:L-fucose mutarotase